MNFYIALLLAYLLGSVSFAVVVSRFSGLADPRSYGSGNPGATNVLRSGNKKAALLTLLGDALKGAVAIWLARWAGFEGLAVAQIGLAAFVGHLYPVFLKFKGGKGVATAAGVLLALSPLMGVLVMLTWLLVAMVSKYSSLAAILAAMSAPLWGLLINQPKPEVLMMALMSAALVARHQANIHRLLAGEESKIGSKKRR